MYILHIDPLIIPNIKVCTKELIQHQNQLVILDDKYMYIILQSINIHTFYLHRQKYPQRMPNNCTHS